jgi:membrane protein YdbS with pleckstrin-like domain
MNCSACGKVLTAESRFCSHCGSNVTAVRAARELDRLPGSASAGMGAAREARRSDPDDALIFRLRPSFHRVGLSYLLAAGVSLLAAAVAGFFDLPPTFIFAAAACLFAVPACRHLQRNLTSYTLTAGEIEISAGLFSRSTHHVPLGSVQNIFVSASLAERLAGIGNVVIDSASEAGKIQLRHVRNPRKYADLILQQLRRRR